MKSRHFDTIIIGQGLAGTTLTWHLLRRHQNILVLDQEDSVTSSKIAAGLVTPITGMRLVISWRFQELIQTAEQFYRHIEQETASRFYHQRGMIRFFTSNRDQERFTKKLETEEFRKLVQRPISGFDRNLLSSPMDVDGFEMPRASQLYVSRYLEVSRKYFQKRQCYRTACVDPIDDINLTATGVQLPKLNISATQLIFCRGADDRSNPWFSQIKFKPAQGEILTLEVPEFRETRIINQKSWLAPMPENKFAAGSTYEWNQLDSKPTANGKEQITSNLKQLLRCPFQIIDHRAAIRPALQDQKPIIGRHPQFKQLGILNGLGSKGSLQAPWLAMQLTNHLSDGTPIDAQVDLNRRYPA